jgi:RNA polymerase sigma-70 factor (ECF subfamily)
VAYGRLIALLAAPTGDLALAEDALAGAFERALDTWPRTGVPDNPEGWLLTVGRNRLRDVWKSSAHRTRAPLDDATASGADAFTTPFDDVDPDAIPDDRLRLLFVCAHPAIDPAARTPLMLQTVLGLDAARIATALAVPTRPRRSGSYGRRRRSGTPASRSAFPAGPRCPRACPPSSRPSTAATPWHGRTTWARRALPARSPRRPSTCQ